MFTWLSPSSLPILATRSPSKHVSSQHYVSFNSYLFSCNIEVMAVFAAESSRLGLQPLDIEEHLESYHWLMSNELSMRWS